MWSGRSTSWTNSKTNTSKFQFDLETVDEEPPRGNATANSLLLLLLLLLFSIITRLFWDTSQQFSSSLAENEKKRFQ